MGKKKKDSTDRHKIRLSNPPEKRDTLLPCPACGGEKQRPKDLNGEATGSGAYSIKFIDCKWCDGSGVVDATMRKLFRRWIRIYACNIAAGRCPRHEGSLSPRKSRPASKP